MKIIESLKQVKDLKRKAADLRAKVAKFSAHLSYETPAYSDQTKQIGEWVQAHADILREIASLRLAIQKTNLETMVTIKLDGKDIKKSIAYWIHRRRDLAEEELLMYNSLTDRGLKEGSLRQSTDAIIEVKIVRCYDPAEKDKKTEILSSEPSLIDSKLEIINAVTDLLE